MTANTATTEPQTEVGKRLSYALEQFRGQVQTMEKEGRLQPLKLPPKYAMFEPLLHAFKIELSYEFFISSLKSELVKHAEQDPKGTKEMLRMLNEATGYVLGYTDTLNPDSS